MIQIDYPCHRHWCPLVCARLTHYLDMAYFDMPVKDHWLIHLWLQGEIPVPWVLSNRDGDQPGINLGPSSKLPQKCNTGRLESMMPSNQNPVLYNGSCELVGCLRSLLQYSCFEFVLGCCDDDINTKPNQYPWNQHHHRWAELDRFYCMVCLQSIGDSPCGMTWTIGMVWTYRVTTLPSYKVGNVKVCKPDSYSPVVPVNTIGVSYVRLKFHSKSPQRVAAKPK